MEATLTADGASIHEKRPVKQQWILLATSRRGSFGRILGKWGMPNLLGEALAKVRDGITSFDEAEGMKWV
jgi:hypothetical protein